MDMSKCYPAEFCCCDILHALLSFCTCSFMYFSFFYLVIFVSLLFLSYLLYSFYFQHSFTFYSFNLNCIVLVFLKHVVTLVFEEANCFKEWSLQVLKLHCVIHTNMPHSPHFTYQTHSPNLAVYLRCKVFHLSLWHVSPAAPLHDCMLFHHTGVQL